ncbi:hypothetical protein [Streptomyces anulatus]|uniref:hypothetical protein n=1 Tax=Streptomyces anulatus TaxID=1892 RepID=UPI001C25F224|nr:hypothetical protein [Streptomyces anulatus]
MSSSTAAGGPRTSAPRALTVLAWRAEVLVDVQEHTEKVTCRGEGLRYDGPSETVAARRREVDTLLELVERPMTAREVDEATVEVARLVAELEQRGGTEAGGAVPAAPPVSS